MGRVRCEELVDELGFKASVQSPQALCEAVVRLQRQVYPIDFGSGRGVGQSIRDRRRVRPNQPALSELRAAKIPGYDSDDVTDIGVQQHIQHRTPRCSVRLAIITETNPAGPTRRADHERVTMMVRVWVPASHLGDKGLSVGDAGGGRQIAVKATFEDF